jgi:hypothetical protein
VPFGTAAELVAGLAGITVNAQTVERSAEASGAAARKAGAAEGALLRARVLRPLPPPEPVPDMLYVEVDGTGVPVRASETEGRPGKGKDGTAGTREIKLARLFTVSALDDDGNPVMDPGSATYVAAFDGKDALAELVEAEYLRRSGGHFRQVVAMGDGAAWTLAEAFYPHATHITDVWHAREHLADLAAHLAFHHPQPAPMAHRPQRRTRRREHRGDPGRRPAVPASRHQGRRLDKKLGYFERNAHRMRYQHFRGLGMFTGSGAIEGAINAIVVHRTKQSGMHWTTDGAASIIALRCQHASGRWYELWPATTPPAQLHAAV